MSNGWGSDGTVTFSGDSGWFLLSTVESYNGQYGSSHGDPTEFFAATGFGGTAYANTPAFFVGHTEEPYLPGINDKWYEYMWASGMLAIEAAWQSKNVPVMIAVGDPLVKR